MKTTTYIFTVICLLIVSVTSMAANTRIIGGSEVTEENQDTNYPWMSSLYLDGGFICGATLIAPQWVLTAAHCLVDEESGEVFATDFFMVGVHDFDLNNFDDDEYIQVSEVYMAAGYDNFSADNDIAILKLAQPATATPVSLIETTAFDELADGIALTVMGWGNTIDDVEIEPVYSLILREVDVNLANYQTCFENYAATGQAVTTNMFCAGGNGVTDSCRGDSGGPIVHFIEGGYQQVGIVSWGGVDAKPCAGEGYPGVYTRLSKYTPWIESVLVGNEIQDFIPEDESPVNNPHTGSTRKKPSVGSMGLALLLLFPILFRGRKIKYGKR